MSLEEYCLLYRKPAVLGMGPVYTGHHNKRVKTVAPYNHQSLKAEHGRWSLSTILIKHLTEIGQMWPKCLPLATLAYNTFNSPDLANYSPYELVFGRKPKILLDLETDPDIKISGMFTDYYTLLDKRLKYLQTYCSNLNPNV